MATSAETRRAYLVLVAMPLFFSSNLVLGRAAVEMVEPGTLAFFRWALAAGLLAPFVIGSVVAHAEALRAAWRSILVLGILGMLICGALVYLALRATTATNATLIYTTSPVFVVLIEAMRGRKIKLRQAVGIAAAILGVAVIVLRGDLPALLSLGFSLGDVGILICAFAWAVYSVVLKQEAFRPIPTLTLFAVVAATGAAILLPVMAAETTFLGTFPTGTAAWLSILALAIVPSILAFGTYQYGVKVVGPAVTSVFMYLLPAYGVGLAVLFLGEQLQMFHLVGLVLVTAGVVLATAPGGLFARAPAGEGRPHA